MTLVLNDAREILLMYRHRWIIDQWVWELPGGYVDHADTRPDINEAETIRWVSLGKAVEMIDRGEIVGAATVVGVYRALTLS